MVTGENLILHILIPNTYLPQHNIDILDYVHDIELVYQYSSKTEVLDMVPMVHKEFSSTVECILSNTV